MTLLTRLKPEYLDVLKTSKNALCRRVINILDNESIWLNLTINDADTVLLVLENKNFTNISLLSNLFTDE